MKKLILCFAVLFLLAACAEDFSARDRVRNTLENEYSERGYELFGWVYDDEEVGKVANEITTMGLSVGKDDIAWAGEYSIVKAKEEVEEEEEEDTEEETSDEDIVAHKETKEEVDNVATIDETISFVALKDKDNIKELDVILSEQYEYVCVVDYYVVYSNGSGENSAEVFNDICKQLQDAEKEE